MMKTIMGLLMVFGLVAIFQNCSNVKFNDGSSTSPNGKLTALGLEPNEDDLVHVESGTGPEGLADSGTSPHEVPPPVEVSGDQGLVACILKEHGKSLKLGLIEEKLGGVHSVAKSVCVTRHGCLELVSAKFSVLGAYDRGYCGHNPNVVVLSDKELSDLLSK